jgi:hypothetical protein
MAVLLLLDPLPPAPSPQPPNAAARPVVFRLLLPRDSVLRCVVLDSAGIRRVEYHDPALFVRWAPALEEPQLELDWALPPELRFQPPRLRMGEPEPTGAHRVRASPRGAASAMAAGDAVERLDLPPCRKVHLSPAAAPAREASGFPHTDAGGVPAQLRRGHSPFDRWFPTERATTTGHDGSRTAESAAAGAVGRPHTAAACPGEQRRGPNLCRRHGLEHRPLPRRHSLKPPTWKPKSAPCRGIS